MTGSTLTKEERLLQYVAKALGDTMQQLVFQFEGKKHIVTELFIANDSMLPDDVLYKGRLCLRGDVSGGCPAFSVTRSLMVPHSVTRSLILVAPPQDDILSKTCVRLRQSNPDSMLHTSSSQLLCPFQNTTLFLCSLPHVAMQRR